MEISLKYGRGQLAVSVPEANYGGVLLPGETPICPDPDREIRQALASPIGSPRLRELVRPGEKIAIVTSDISRPCPSHLLLPPVLDELEEAGVNPADVTIVLALGIHRGHTMEEMANLVGPAVLAKYRVIDSSPDCVRLGATAAGTPVDIFRPVAGARRRICLGNVEFHYFAGYSGGAKAIMPGVSSHAAIQSNHRMMVEEGARAGVLEGNPVRADIDAVGGFLAIDFIVNVILDAKKNVLAAFAGHYLEAHRAACRRLDSIYKVDLPAPGADVVVVSAGGFPKDMNVYQAQKALDNAAKAVRPGGIIVWVAECAEGYGEEVFAAWLQAAKTPADLIARVRSNFELGGHKAAAMAMVRDRVGIYMVSGLDDAAMRGMFVVPKANPTVAVADALRELGPRARVWVMPYGGSVLPQLR